MLGYDWGTEKSPSFYMCSIRKNEISKNDPQFVDYLPIYIQIQGHTLCSADATTPDKSTI
jgi:hypothetical protein